MPEKKLSWLEIATKEWDKLHAKKQKLESELKATEEAIEILKKRIRRDVLASRESK